jgi:threonyl-tRNA synthetase
MVLYQNLERYIREENERRGYSEIRTPIILNEELWHRSGHWDNFRENMYFTDIDETGYAVKPMNCPGGLLIYKTQLHSYRDLPIRNAELGLVHRHELSGVLHGLFRVRSFTQDDAHIFCTEEQLTSEIIDTIRYTLDVYKVFGFEDISVFIATRPEKAIGSDEVWEFATDALLKALDECDIAYKIKEGEGAFYGPKIEFNIKDTLERNWQCGTIQVDLSMPARFDITYEGSDGQRHTPVMVHRAIFGSLERFIGILIEHFNGKFPLWFSPKQIVFVPVAASDEGQMKKCRELNAAARDAGLRTLVDERNENLGYKIRYWRLQRIPYTVIIGENEVSADTVSLRLRSGKEVKGLAFGDVVSSLKKEIAQRMNSSIYEGDVSS